MLQQTSLTGGTGVTLYQLSKLRDDSTSRITLHQLLELIDFNSEHYISGMPALNIYDYEFNTGDWHTRTFWENTPFVRRFGIMGMGEEHNTNAYLGNRGVFDASPVLKKMGVPIHKTIYAANHARAIADMVICKALNDNKPFIPDMFSLDDFMPALEDKERVYAMLEYALDKLPRSAANRVQQYLKTAKETHFEH